MPIVITGVISIIYYIIGAVKLILDMVDKKGVGTDHEKREMSREELRKILKDRGIEAKDHLVNLGVELGVLARKHNLDIKIEDGAMVIKPIRKKSIIEEVVEEKKKKK